MDHLVLLMGAGGCSIFGAPWLGLGLLASEDSAEVFFERREELVIAKKNVGWRRCPQVW
jgi:hypothetical protein